MLSVLLWLILLPLVLRLRRLLVLCILLRARLLLWLNRLLWLLILLLWLNRLLRLLILLLWLGRLLLRLLILCILLRLFHGLRFVLRAAKRAGFQISVIVLTALFTFHCFILSYLPSSCC